jgi:cation transport ATPase
MRRGPIRLHPRFRSVGFLVLAVLFASGVAWAALHYWPGSNDSPERSTLQPTLMKLHGAAAMATLILIGMLLPTHVRAAWRARRNRINGTIVLGSLALLTLTGYGLYYIGGESLRAVTSYSHLALGVMLPILLFLHIAQGRKTRPDRKR